MIWTYLWWLNKTYLEKFPDHEKKGNSLVVQWLRAHALIAEGLGSIPDGETKIPQAMWGEKK